MCPLLKLAHPIKMSLKWPIPLPRAELTPKGGRALCFRSLGNWKFHTSLRGNKQRFLPIVGATQEFSKMLGFQVAVGKVAGGQSKLDASRKIHTAS